jgi:hypothetical protein
MAAHRNVLLIGLDPHAVPGVDAALVDTAIAFNTNPTNSVDAALRWLPRSA